MSYKDAFKKGFIGSENKYNEFINLLSLNDDSIPEGYEINKIVLDNEVCKNIEIFLDLTVDQNIVVRSKLNSQTGKPYNFFLHNGYTGTHSRRDFISFTPVASYSFTRATSDDIILGEIGPNSEFFTNIHYSEETKILVVNTFDKEVRLSTDLYNLQETLSGKLVLYTKIPMDALTGSIDIVKFPYYVESDYELAVVDGFRGTEADFASIGSGSGSMNVLFKVENSNLQVSYDGGSNWTALYDIGALKGKSAYDLAVDHGYTGTEEEWVKSLEPVNGKSAYQIAVEYGFAGTAQEWLDYLKGGGTSGPAWPGLSPLPDNALSNVNGIYLSKSMLGSGSGTGTAIIPEIGANGNWFVDNVDTGKSSRGLSGETPYIGTNGNWWIGTSDTGKKAQGANGEAPRIETDGKWWVGTVNTGILARGDKGESGKDFRIEKIYTSVALMEAAFSTTDVSENGFALVYTGLDSDEDNGKLFIKGETTYQFLKKLTDLDSLKGEDGAAGSPGPVGPAPLLKLNGNYLQVSYDKGFTWSNLVNMKDFVPSDAVEKWKASKKEFNALVEMEDGWYVQMPEIPDTTGTTTVIKRYLSNPSQTWSSDFLTPTLESDAGSLIPARSSILSAPIVKRVSLPSNVIAETDEIRIQVSLTGKEWFDLPVTLGGNTLPPYDGQYGLGIEFVEGNKINFIIGCGVNANKPWDFNFWWRICILRYTQVIVQYPLVAVLNEMSDASMKAADDGILVRKGSKTRVEDGLVLPKVPIGDTGSKWPTLRGINGEPVWDIDAPAVQYNNFGGITPVNAVLAAPSINGKAAYMKVDHYGKKVHLYPSWTRANGKPVLNRLDYKNWAYALFDPNEAYLIPIWEKDYLGYWFFSKTNVNMIRVNLFDNYGVDPYAFPRTFTIQINEDGRLWKDHKVVNINTREYVYDLQLDEAKDLYGIRVLFTNFQNGMKTYARVKNLDIGIMNESTWNTAIVSAPFEVFESDNFSTSPLILSFHDGYDAGGLREIIKEFTTPLSGDIVDLAATQYVYAKYTPATDETTIHCQAALIPETDTGDRWYDAGNTTSTADANIIYSGNRSGYPASNAFNKDTGTGSGWISGATVNSTSNNTAGCVGQFIGQKNLTGQIRQVSVVNWNASPHCPQNVVVEYSVDGVNWSILKYHTMNQASSAWNNIVMPEYEIMNVPYMMRVRALDNTGSNMNDWHCAQVLMYTDRKYNDDTIFFNTRTYEYKDGHGNTYDMLYLGRINRYNATDNNIAYTSNLIVSSERESKNYLTNYSYTDGNRWRSQGTSGWFGLANCKRSLGRMTWLKHNSTSYSPSTIHVEIQRDNNPSGSWELVKTITGISTAALSTNDHTFEYECDTIHCIRFRCDAVAGGDSWIVHWAKFYEKTPEDGNHPYHYGYHLIGQQSLGKEYESDWFAVGTSGTYTLFNPLASADLEVHVVWSASNSFDNCCPITTGYRTTDGVSVKVDRSNITIITGSSYTMSNQHYQSGGGYYKVFARRRY